MIRDYIRGNDEDLTLQKLAFQADGSFQAMQLDGRFLKNGFTNLVLYTDSGGASPIPGGVDGENYEYGAADTQWTADESGFSGLTVYAELKVSNATYQGIDLWADFKNFGTYTSNDANFSQQGGVIEVTASGTIEIPAGYQSVLINCDTDAGDITLSGSNAGFAGQRIRVKNTGTSGNLVYCKLTGAYLGGSSIGTPISDGLMWRGDSDGSTIDPVNEITADYVSGNYNIRQNSSGLMFMVYTDTFVFSATSNVTKSLTFPVAFLSSPVAGSVGGHTTATFTTTNIWLTSTTGGNFRMRNEGGAVGSFTSDPSWASFTGKY